MFGEKTTYAWNEWTEKKERWKITGKINNFTSIGRKKNGRKKANIGIEETQTETERGSDKENEKREKTKKYFEHISFFTGYVCVCVTR